MGFTVQQGNSVELNLPELVKSTGWSFDSNVAIHDSCNAGSMYLSNQDIETGRTYRFSYSIESISGGYIQPSIGTATGTQRTTAGFYVEEIVATGSTPKLSFYSNASLRMTLLDVQDITVSSEDRPTNTIAYNEVSNKWTDFRTFVPDGGFSLFTNLYTFKSGLLYRHHVEANRNNFYGTQYSSYIKPVFNNSPQVTKTFQEIIIRANQLFITTQDGIETSIAQVSDLIAEDWKRDTLSDGVTSVNIYTYEGEYKAQFLRDKNTGIIDGDLLKGSYMAINLVCDSTDEVKLFSISVNAVQSYNS